jgi:hypothetical protein
MRSGSGQGTEAQSTRRALDLRWFTVADYCKWRILGTGTKARHPIGFDWRFPVAGVEGARIVADKATLLRQLAVLLANGAPGLSLAARLAGACVALLEVEGASITVEAATPNRVTLAATDQISAELEQLQDVLSQGPCWDAYLSGSPQTTNLIPQQDWLWPQFGPAAREAVGSRTLFGLPMTPQGQTLGVLSVHLAGTVELPIGLEDSQFLADTIGAALLLDPQQHDPYGQAGPWSGRSQVHQATGMVIAQLRIPANDAMAILRAHAYAHNTGLDDIAQQILRGTLTFEPGSDT